MQKALLVTVPLGLLLWLYSSKTAVPGLSELPRGIRNNNPGNLEFNDRVKWQGQIGSDGRFIIFDTPANGLRALGRTLLTYRSRDGVEGYGSAGVDTITEVINRYAPSSENNTGSYINHVSSQLNVSPDTALEYSDYPNLMAAIIKHENGQQPYSMAELNQGWRAAA
ncbi:virion protein [Agarivorans sp. QJM3NY_25]|uniref:virion protein n=1 Tax=Agarivorans sp. QJM3NY_25 TaxID=3421430 RepID=UPI003D7E0BBC